MITNVLRTIRKSARNVLGISGQFARLQQQIDESKILAARVLINQMKFQGMYENIHDAEFKVFSQWGDDGIIQYLVHHLAIEPQTFIEFGVQDYRESNTRFLLMNNNWTGLVIDGGKKDIDYIMKDCIYWRYDLTAVCAFVDKENINRIFVENGFDGEIGILSVDIDGNDYWIWNAIKVVNPIIVIMEYNSVFGIDRAITIPYEPSFYRTKAHYSNLYWGASLLALCDLAEEKGYFFVGCNSNGNNAYFIRKDKIGNMKVLTPKEGYVYSKFRESRDKGGNLNHINGKNRLEVIRGTEVYNTRTDKLQNI